jgi:hypothetical protein
MINVRLLSFFGPTASGWESEVEMVVAEYPCDLWLGCVLEVDDNERPIKHDESGKNSEDHEIIFQQLLDRVIEGMGRTEVETSRVCSGTPNNPVGFVEGF